MKLEQVLLFPFIVSRDRRLILPTAVDGSTAPTVPVYITGSRHRRTVIGSAYMFGRSDAGFRGTLEFDASGLGGLTLFPEPDFDHTTWEYDAETGVHTMTTGKLMAVCLGTNPAWDTIAPIEID